MIKYIIAIIFSILVSAVILAITKNYELGMTPDSVDYLELAENIQLGNAPTTNEGKLVNDWPPLYPIVLAYFSKAIGIGILSGSKYLSATLIFFLFSVFNLILIKQVKTDVHINAILNILLLISAPLMVFTMLWSEGLFILLLLTMMYLLLEYIEDHSKILLILAGLTAGTMVLTRYAGLAFVIGVIIYLILFDRRGLKERLMHSLIFSIPSVIFLFGWLLYSGTFDFNDFTYKQIAFHPVSFTHFKRLFTQFIAWIIPSYIQYSVIVIILLLSWILIKTRKLQLVSLYHFLSDSARLIVVLIITYIIVLLASISFLDAYIPINNRTLSPLFPLLLLLLGLLIKHLVRLENIRKPTVLLLTFIMVNMAYSYSKAFQSFRNNGVGYTSKEWVQSQIVKETQTLDVDTIYTNSPDALRFCLSNNKSVIRMLPEHISPHSGKKNEDYDRQLASLVESIKDGNNAVVHFDLLAWRYNLPSKDLIIDLFNEEDILELSDGIIIR